MFTLPVKFIKIIIFNDLLNEFNIYNTVFKIVVSKINLGTF